jgi:hypothetical protein
MSINCAKCKATNPDQARFCADCGALLDPELGSLEEILSGKVREQVRDILKENYKEQKLLEIETSQAVATRLADWAKLLGFFIGIPIGLLFLVLGAIGLKTYSDFSNQVHAAQTEIEQQVHKAQTEIGVRLDTAQKAASKLQSDASTISREYENLTAGLENTKRLAGQVGELTAQYQTLAASLEKTKELANRVEILDQKVVNIEDSIKSALVLGNNNYDGPWRLRSAVPDAEAINAALKDLGFQVSKGLDLDRTATYLAIKSFAGRLNPGDTAFVFYSGHGMQVDGHNYFLPVNAPSSITTDSNLMRVASISGRCPGGC